MKINAGGATGGSPTGGEVHSDAIDITETPQANGGVKPIVTSHMTGNSGLMAGERDLGNMSKNKPF